MRIGISIGLPPGNERSASPAFGGTVSDNFQRVDGPLGANWGALAITTSTGSLTITSEKVTETVSGQHAISGWISNTFADDQFAECSVANVTGGDFAGPAVRCNPATNSGYVLFANGATALVFMCHNGVESQIGSVTFGSVPGPTDIVRLEVAGSVLTAKLNGTVAGTVTDTTLTSGAPGIGLVDVLATVTNFTGGPTI